MLKIFEIRVGRISAVVGIKDDEVEVLECSNYTNCKIQGVVTGNLSDGCPRFCPVIVAAKKHERRKNATVRILKP